MTNFDLSIQLTTPEYFNPALGSFTILDGITTDDSGNNFVTVKVNMLQNHITLGNTTSRSGTYQVPKEAIDALQIDFLTGAIGNKPALIALLNNFNITILNSEYQL